MIKRVARMMGLFLPTNGNGSTEPAPPLPPHLQEGNDRGLRPLVRHLGHTLLAGRVWLLAMGHLACFGLVYWLAFVMRFDFHIPPPSMRILLWSLPWVLAVKLVVFYACGHYHGWWSYVTFRDLTALLRAAVLSSLLLAAIDYFLIAYQIPRIVLALDLLLTIMLFGLLRASWRMLREQITPALWHPDCRNALMIGANRSAGVLASQIHSCASLKYRICGFLATNGEKRGSHLGQIRVLGGVQELGRIAARYAVEDVLIPAGTIPGDRLRQLINISRDAGLTLKFISQPEELFNGDHRMPVRDIDISDLLRRDPVRLDSTAIAELLSGRCVLVTGAGGSIGSEICRQLPKFRPQQLVLLGRGENRLFFIERELSALISLGPQAGEVSGAREDSPSTVLHCRVGDVTDVHRMRQVFDEFRPQIVFHAAAHKHVPMMEDNPGEAVKNNVGGTKVVADLAHQFGAQRFVLISSDKAVRPTSVMGATKHLAERYVLALSQESKTRFVVTRFGNVLASAGSVVPIFQQQIRRGGPITVTDPRMTRYFMSIPEASQLVLQAMAMGHGGEIFVLDMGEPVRIEDLARDMIRLSGLPEDAIELVYTGVRPGEKMYEELYFEDEQMLDTSHEKLHAAYHRPYATEDVRREVAELVELADRPDVCIWRSLRQFVPEFTPYCDDCDDCDECPKLLSAAPEPLQPVAAIPDPVR